MVCNREARKGGPRAASIRAIAPQLDVGEETLPIWCNRRGPTEPAGPGKLLEKESRRLRGELAEARRAYEILEAALASFAVELDHLTTKGSRSSTGGRGQFGGEAVCCVLGATGWGIITSRRCRAAKSRPASAEVVTLLPSALLSGRVCCAGR